MEELIDAIDYKNGSKNHWRRTMWNVLSERVQDRKHATVLYLPGSRDLDRAEALRRGFRPWNLIAVETNNNVVRHLRARGVNTIRGSLIDVVSAWPTSQRLDVIVADLQCGMTTAALQTIYLWASSTQCANTVLAINLQRGRDPGKTLEGIRDVCDIPVFKKIQTAFQLERLSRSSMAVAAAAVCFTLNLRRACESYGDLSVRINSITADEDKFLLCGIAHLGWQIVSPYRSAKCSPLFDTAIMWWKLPFDVMRVVVSGDKRAKRRIAAALAIRTMRNKELS